MQFEERLHQPRKYSITVTLEKVVLTFDKKLFGESSAKSTSTRVYLASVIFSALPVFFSEKSCRAKRGSVLVSIGLRCRPSDNVEHFASVIRAPAAISNLRLSAGRFAI